MIWPATGRNIRPATRERAASVRRLLPWAAIALLLAVGVAGSTAAAVQQRRLAEERDAAAAKAAVASVKESLTRALSALRGVDGLAADGVVSDVEFDLFARDVLTDSPLVSLAREVAVPRAGRASFERERGFPIRERDGAGELVVAAERDVYIAVVQVVPLDGTTRPVLGFDIGSEAVRGPAVGRARQSGGPVLAGPTGLASDNRPGVFVVDAIMPGGASSAPVGYVSAALAADDLLRSAASAAGRTVELGLAVGGTTLTGYAGPGTRREVAAGGLTLTIVAHDRSPFDPALTLAIGVCTLLLTAVSITLRIRNVQLDRARRTAAAEQQIVAQQAAAFAALAAELSAAAHTDDVLAVIARLAPDVLGAQTVDTIMAETETETATGAALGPGAGAGAGPPVTETLEAMPGPDNAVVGWLVVRWKEPLVPDARGTAALRALAGLCAQTIIRAQLSEAERRVVSALQQALLPSPPPVPGIETAVYYRPAADSVAMGGDWYQFVALPDGSLIVLVGDVVGHGVAGIATMARLQYLVAAAVDTGVPMAETFSFVTGKLPLVPEMYATAQLLHVDPAGRRVGLLSAGHPYPLLRTADGNAVALTGGRTLPIGVPASPVTVEYVEVPPGSILLAYTDGLVEGRGQPIMEAIDKLGRALASALAESAPAMLQSVLSAAPPGFRAADDDVAAVLIRLAGAPGR
ncbi:SpoIIE family protein phosphatase [Dactylosporangium sp. NPDC051541]|uniref:SpoIIE family protein phosphatase n=1 Tax=Dactylosporangium sp. NPDC051541 TaxID=3363977 RepID=UPI0037BD4826